MYVVIQVCICEKIQIFLEAQLIFLTFDFTSCLVNKSVFSGETEIKLS